jgi:hypothetical protein
MMAPLSRLVLAVTLAASLGLHWALLQSVAWTGMIITYSNEGTFGEALSKTFDGKHPCSICKQIDEGKKSEQKSCLKIDGKKLEFVDAQREFTFNPPSSFFLLSISDDSAPEFSLLPSLPPPRLV